MSELAEFLRAQVDKDEQIARAAIVAAAAPWRLTSEQDDSVLRDAEGISIADDRADFAMQELQQFARHEPTRVLAAVESARRILHEHRDDGDGGCWGCGLGNDGERRYKVEECPTKRALAVAYAGESGYREEWRP